MHVHTCMHTHTQYGYMYAPQVARRRLTLSSHSGSGTLQAPCPCPLATFALWPRLPYLHLSLRPGVQVAAISAHACATDMHGAAVLAHGPLLPPKLRSANFAKSIEIQPCPKYRRNIIEIRTAPNLESNFAKLWAGVSQARPCTYRAARRYKIWERRARARRRQFW